MKERKSLFFDAMDCRVFRYSYSDKASGRLSFFFMRIPAGTVSSMSVSRLSVPMVFNMDFNSSGVMPICLLRNVLGV